MNGLGIYGGFSGRLDLSQLAGANDMDAPEHESCSGIDRSDLF